MKYLVTDWLSHSEALTRIRTEVFLQEQQVPVADEWDGKDGAAVHFIVIADNGSAVACARLLIEQSLLHIGRVAVLKPWRQQGIGHQLMEFILRWCATQYPQNRIYLHAQTSRVAFYERLGFSSHGDVFMDAGIPHIEMWFTANKQINGGETHE